MSTKESAANIVNMGTAVIALIDAMSAEHEGNAANRRKHLKKASVLLASLLGTQESNPEESE